MEFGKELSDHMLLVEWKKEAGWDTPKIVPFGNLPLSPALSALQYAIAVCELQSISGHPYLEGV